MSAVVTQTQYATAMKSAVIPQVRVEPELRAELEAVLQEGETLSGFVEASVHPDLGTGLAKRRRERHARHGTTDGTVHRLGAVRRDPRCVGAESMHGPSLALGVAAGFAAVAGVFSGVRLRAGANATLGPPEAEAGATSNVAG